MKVIVPQVGGASELLYISFTCHTTWRGRRKMDAKSLLPLGGPRGALKIRFWREISDSGFGIIRKLFMSRGFALLGRYPQADRTADHSSNRRRTVRDNRFSAVQILQGKFTASMTEVEWLDKSIRKIEAGEESIQFRE